MNEAPNHEMAERLAESSPVMVLPRVIAAEDYRLSQAAYRDRVSMAHAAGWAALGMADDVPKVSQSSADMGGISIQGDTYQYYGDASTKQLPGTVPTPAPPQPGTLAKLAGPALLGAALLGSGAGGVALYNALTAMPDNYTEPATPRAFDPADWKFGVEVKDHQ